MSTARAILLVEDNPMDIDLTLRAFKRRKLVNPIDVAYDGEEALRHIEAWEAGAAVPLVVLLDINLPRISGLQVLRRIKESPTLRAIPVVMLTTSADSGDISEAYRLGGNSYIVKPVDFDKFIEVAAAIELYWCALNRPLDDPHGRIQWPL